MLVSQISTSAASKPFNIVPSVRNVATRHARGRAGQRRLGEARLRRSLAHPREGSRCVLRSSGVLDACESALYDSTLITAIRRILASVLALLVVVATLGRVRVNWTGTRTAEDASGDRSAAVVRDRDAR